MFLIRCVPIGASNLIFLLRFANDLRVLIFLVTLALRVIIKLEPQLSAIRHDPALAQW